MGRARALHPAATRKVASGRVITAGPRTVASSGAPVSTIAPGTQVGWPLRCRCNAGARDDSVARRLTASASRSSTKP